MQNIDILSIGDMVIDAFIRLIEAEDSWSADHSKRNLCMTFGDKIPFEFADVIPGVGNSPNAAVSAARLGLSSYLLSNIGNDEYGKACLASHQKDGVHTDFIKINNDLPTNYHYVLWFQNERTILIKHQNYVYDLPAQIKTNPPKWIYLSSLPEASLPFHKILETYLNEHPEVQLAFQPGTFQMTLGTDALSGIYRNTTIFFCNVEEAQRILKTEEKDVKKLMIMMSSLGPKNVVITDGPAGAYSYDKLTGEAWFMSSYPDPKPPYERTGAGDAFSSTYASARIHGKTIPEALAWGSINSMSVVQFVGAQEGLLPKEKIEEYLAKKPAEFIAKKI